MPLYTSEDFTVEVGSSGGIVASVDVSGGTSGLVFSGGPITGSGVITLASGQLVAGYGGTGLTGFTAGPVMFGATTTAMGQDTALWWDNSNKRLGIGTNSPAQQFVTTGKTIFGSTLTGSGTTATPSVSWQFGDGGNIWNALNAFNYGVVFGSNIALPSAGTSYVGIGSTPGYTGAGTLNEMFGMYSAAEHKSVGNTITRHFGSMSRASVSNSSGTSTATSMIGSQSFVLFANAGIKQTSQAIGSAATLNSYIGALSSISNYTAFRADNTSTPGDGSVFHDGYQDVNCVIGNMRGFYYTLPMVTPTGFHAAFSSDPIPDSTGYSTQYGLYLPGTITWATGAGGWIVNAGSGKNYMQGRLGIGTIAPESPLEVASLMGTYTTSPANTWPNGVTITQYGGAAPATLSLRATQGVARNAEILANLNDCVGQITFAGYNNTTRGYPPTAIIAARMDQTPTAGGNSPTGLEMWTGVSLGTVNGAAYGLPMQGNPYYGAPYKRMTMDSTGTQTLYDQPFCVATNTAAQSLTSGVITDIVFNQNVSWQSDPSRGGTLVHDTVTNNTRFVANKAGVYLMVARVSFTASNLGARSCFISKLGVGAIARANNMAPSASDGSPLECTALTYMNAGDYLIVSALQTTGSALTIGFGIGTTDASFVKVA